MGGVWGWMKCLGWLARRRGPELFLVALFGNILLFSLGLGLDVPPLSTSEKTIVWTLTCLTGAFYGVWSVRRPWRAAVAFALAWWVSPTIYDGGPPNGVAGLANGCFVGFVFGIPSGVLRWILERNAKKRPPDWGGDFDGL